VQNKVTGLISCPNVFNRIYLFSITARNFVKRIKDAALTTSAVKRRVSNAKMIMKNTEEKKEVWKAPSNSYWLLHSKTPFPYYYHQHHVSALQMRPDMTKESIMP
jgi:hypothetical protein